MRLFLANVRRIVTSYGAVWQGYIVGTCEIDHQPRKVIFSVYGGFFLDATTGQYFEIPNDLRLRSNWHTYLSSSLNAADSHATIP